MEKDLKYYLYEVNKNVKCLKCGCKGAVKLYGAWYPKGVKNMPIKHDKNYMARPIGFGGTIPYECLNCENRGLIDINGLEGYKKAFESIKNK